MNTINSNVNSESGINSNISISGTITTSVYDNEDIHKNIPNWEQLSNSEKIKALETHSNLETKSFTTDNVTTVTLHEYLARNLNPRLTNPEDNVAATHAGIGDNGSNGTVSSDTNLNNLLLSKEVSDSLSQNGILTTTLLIGASELNGKTLDEIGIATGDLNNVSTDDTTFLLNHASFTPIEKDNTNSITFTVELEFTNT
jgi:hypothetical protein